MRADKKDHLRLPYFLWVRRRRFDMDDTMLRMALTLTALTLLVGVGSPWWAYPTLVALTTAAWPFHVCTPRTLILWDPTPDQRETWQHTTETEARTQDHK